MARDIKQQVIFNVAPEKVFAALMEQRQHAAFTGDPATISRKAGGAFRCYNDYVTGFNLEIVPNKRIVQAWRSRNWPKGIFSIVTFEFGKMAGGKTKLTFTQVGVPTDDYQEKNRGWRSHYWEPLRRYLELGEGTGN